MRVIEPRLHPPKNKPKRQSRLSENQRKALFITALVFISLGFLTWLTDRHPELSIWSTITGQSHETAAQTTQEPKTIQNFTAEQFKSLYGTFAYPNIQEITTPPAITASPAADRRIRELAEKRGYTLRSVPVAPISKVDEPNLEGDDLLQPLALSAWQDLKAAAAKDKVPLRLLSAYRPINYQRDLFSQRLSVAGAYVVDIGNGLADDKVTQVLSMTAPPGYSRHHTGYTIDLACYPNGGFMEFAKSSCYTWLSKDNYRVAKEHGWIPSYPEGADKQGPEPEPWEYVWVGRDAVIR
jgi:D-alanyl-D-alanine carboxypeptidase